MKKFTLALVTGASSGIGKEMCHLLAGKGIPLLISGRNKERLEKVANDLRQQVQVTICQADLQLPNERKLLVDKIRELSPDLVINNAGFGLYGPAIDMDVKEQGEMIEVNIGAVLEIALESAKALRAAGKKGVILNVASAAALQPMPYFAVYAASKSFVLSFSEAFDAEVKQDGIRVLASCPGVIATGFKFRASKTEPGESAIERKGSGRVMDVHFAAQEIWKQIEDEKPVHVFDWTYRLLTFLSSYLIPRSLMFILIKRDMLARIKPKYK